MRHSERLDARGQADASVLRAVSIREILAIAGHYDVWCVDRFGREKWRDEIENVVTTPGKNVILDQALAGSAYTVVGPYMGLISSTSYVTQATTISSLTSYSGTIVTLVMASATAAPGVGDTFTIAGVTGTGANISTVNGTWVALAGTTSTTLVFSIGVTGQTITTLTGGTVTTASGTRMADTMASHANWLEAGNANTPTYTAPRKTLAWSAASGGSKALSSALAFAITGAGTIKGCFVVFFTSAVSTIDNTSGTLLSAGVFTGGDKVVANTDTVNVSFALSI
jgi:hypothetical protein